MYILFVLHHEKCLTTQTSTQAVGAVGNYIFCTIFYTVNGSEGTINQCVEAVMRFFFLNYISIHLFKLQTAMHVGFHESFAFAFISLLDILQLTSWEARKSVYKKKKL